MFCNLSVIFFGFWCFFSGVLRGQNQNNVENVPLADASRRVRFGIKAGMNLAAFRGAEVRRAEAQVGSVVGLSVCVPLTPRTRRWFLGAELFYVRKSAGARYDLVTSGDTIISGFETPYTSTVKNNAVISLHTLDLPLTVRWQFVRSKDYGAYVTFGGVGSLRLADALTGTTEVFISGINFPPFLGEFFSPKTNFQVADAPISDARLSFTRWDYGLVIGGGTSYELGPRSGRLTFDLRYHHCFPDIEERETEMRTGLFTVLFGYEF